MTDCHKIRAGLGDRVMTLSRRQVLGAAALPLLPRTASAADFVSVTLDTGARLGAIPADFMGLGYEISSVAVPGLLSDKNSTYLRLIQNFRTPGVIRIGGNTSDYASYDARGEAKSLPKGTMVNEASLRELRGFLDAIGWRLIWGLNLGADKLDNAMDEARAVAEIMGDKLIALEVGSEPHLFPNQRHRPRAYDFAMYLSDYRRFKAAIRGVLPRVPFAGPDVAGAVDWFEQFSRQEGDIALLTAHHYITGQANPAATIETMVAPNTRYRASLARFQAAAKLARKPWRMCETASFSGGGKAGVSDTFAAALWSLDYLFELANFSCAGVNMQTGVNHLGWISRYSPIADDMKGNYSAAPEYYGLLAFSLAGRGEMMVSRCAPGLVNLTAYATRQFRNTACIAIINKDQYRDATVTIRGASAREAQLMRLTAPSLTATGEITLGGASVNKAGFWSGKRDRIRLEGGVAVPAASAALVWFKV